MSDYRLSNAWEHERRRLALLERGRDPGTIDQLEATGVGPGWRCLEVGAGGGSIARWLCRRVGPTGKVVAVDLDTRFVREVEAANLEAVERDIVAAGIPGDGYDLIHSRAVLMHLPARERLLAELVAHLAPGGWLVLEDGDDTPLVTAPDNPFERVLRVVTAPGRSVSYQWARTYPARFTALGLTDVHAELRAGMIQGGSPAAEFWTLSLRHAGDRLTEEGGIPPALIEAALAALADPTRWLVGTGTISARGRKPGRPATS